MIYRGWILLEIYIFITNFYYISKFLASLELDKKRSKKLKKKSYRLTILWIEIMNCSAWYEDGKDTVVRIVCGKFREIFINYSFYEIKKKKDRKKTIFVCSLFTLKTGRGFQLTSVEANFMDIKLITSTPDLTK